MAKTTIKTYFTTVMDEFGYNEIIRVDGSAEQCQGYTRGIATLKYSGLSIPAGKKVIKHTIKLHLSSPSREYCPYSSSDAAPDGYTIQEVTSTNLEVNPTPAIPVRGFAYMQYTAGYANIIKEYDMPSKIASGDWVALEVPQEQNLPSDGAIYIAQMAAYTPSTNPPENRLPGKVAYKSSAGSVTARYYYDFYNFFKANYTDYELSNRSYIETVIADFPQIPTIKAQYWARRSRRAAAWCASAGNITQASKVICRKRATICKYRATAKHGKPSPRQAPTNMLMYRLPKSPAVIFTGAYRP